MTLLDRILARGIELPADPIIATRLERHLRRIQPDPLFRGRLRGQVLNQYVAVREGLVAQPRAATARRQMGVLGRGVLYASLLTALGVTAVGAAAQESLPGEALYPVKLQLEDLRMLVAPPGVRDDLAAMALDERLDEVERLAAAGAWQLVDEAAARAERAEDLLAAMTSSIPSGSRGAQGADAIQRHADRLKDLLAGAPAAAQEGLRKALDASTTDRAPATPEKPEKPEPDQPATGGQPALPDATPDPNPRTSPVPRDPPSDPKGPDDGNKAPTHAPR
jgi:hypothetical protein